MYAPGKVMKSGTWSDPSFANLQITGRTAVIDMNAAYARVARDRADGVTRARYETITMLPDGSSARHRRHEQSDGFDLTTRPAGRALEPAHGDVDDDGRAGQGPRLPLDRRAAARRPRARRRRRPAPRLSGDQPDERADLLPAVPVQGPAAARSLSAPGPVQLGHAFTVDTPAAAASARSRSCASAPRRTRSTRTSASCRCNFTGGAGALTRRRARRTRTSRRPATTCSSSSTTTACRRSPRWCGSRAATRTTCRPRAPGHFRRPRAASATPS